MCRLEFLCESQARLPGRWPLFHVGIHNFCLRTSSTSLQALTRKNLMASPTHKRKGTRKRQKATPITALDATYTNTKGLPILPYELHTEIISYLSSTPVPCMEFGISRPEYRERFDTMFALSRTCSALFHVYHPLLWNDIEACAVRTETDVTSDDFEKEMARELIYQAELVTIRAPEFAQRVQ